MTKKELYERFVRDAEDEFNKMVLRAIRAIKSDGFLSKMEMAGIPLVTFIEKPIGLSNYSEFRKAFIEENVRKKINTRMQEAQLFEEFYQLLKSVKETYCGDERSERSA